MAVRPELDDFGCEEDCGDLQCPDAFGRAHYVGVRRELDGAGPGREKRDMGIMS